jgi:L-amino acid N-acyltransferase YncA
LNAAFTDDCELLAIMKDFFMSVKTGYINDSFIIREATIADLPALVKLHVTSWNATYPDYFPKPSPALREMQWQKAFELKENDWFCYVVQHKDGNIAGFATANNFSDPGLPYTGQLNKIHFYKVYHRMGLGKKLLCRVVHHFLKKGIHSMILFADPANPNISFYDALHGKKLFDTQGKFQGAYGWDDLAELATRCAG